MAQGRRRVVSVSLGSSRRDYVVTLQLLGSEVEVQRRGCDGDLAAAERLITELDGQVDAIGLGGLDVYLRLGEERVVLADGERLLRRAAHTPCVDGSLLKQTLEPAAVRWLAAHGPLPLAGTPALLVSALDRYGMAEALEAAGCQVVYGDLIFIAGIPYPIHSLAELRRMGRRLAREMAKLPLNLLYPVGAAQDADPVPLEAATQQYARAALIAGDFHLIRKHLPGPETMAGKAVLTQTTTRADRALLAAQGVRYLFTTTPVVEGRSLGTNALEAALVAVLQRPPEAIQPAELEEVLRAVAYRPAVLDLQQDAPA